MDSARRLAASTVEADLRRAVSNVYYAPFHMLIDETTQPLAAGLGTLFHAKLGRMFDHKTMKKVSSWFIFGWGNKPPRPGERPKHSPTPGKGLPGFGDVVVPDDLRLFAETFIELQSARADADYDLSVPISQAWALDYIQMADEAIERWERVKADKAARLYLVLLLVAPLIKEREE